MYGSNSARSRSWLVITANAIRAACRRTSASPNTTDQTHTIAIDAETSYPSISATERSQTRVPEGCSRSCCTLGAYVEFGRHLVPELDTFGHGSFARPPRRHLLARAARLLGSALH